MKHTLKNIFSLPMKQVGIVLIVVFFISISCTDSFTEYNTNKAELMEISAKQLGGLFSRSQYSGNSWLTTDNYSRMTNEIAIHFSGFMVTGSIDYEQSGMHLSHQNSGFTTLYSEGMPPLTSIINITKDDDEFVAEYNVALIWKVFLLHRATDLWGPIPYSEAGNGEEAVPYESQKDVYYLMLEDLKNATTALTNALNNDPDINAFGSGSGDLIYNGNVTKWIKFANTLRLRLAMRISNVDPDKAKTEAEAAAAGLTMDTNDDDAMLDVSTLERGNGMPRIESWYANVMSTSMESVLKGYNDPRMQEFFSVIEHNEYFDADGYPEELKANEGGYHGMTSGFKSSLEVNFFYSYSNYGPRFKNGNQLITPINIMHSAETWFLKAEGVWRGWNMGVTAQDAYEKGIEVSIKQWRENEISSDSIQNYINSTLTPVAPNNYLYYDGPMTDIPVKFSSDNDDQYEQIITQKWLALYPIAFEAWAEYRRTRLPKLYAKKASSNSNINVSKGQIVTRLPFVSSEYSANATEVAKAVEMIGGEDLENIPLWWDVNSNGN